MNKLSQVKEYLLEAAFLALLVRVIITGCGIGEALALVSIVSSMTYNKYITKAKLDDRAALEDRLEKALEEVNKKFDDMSNKVNSLSMNQSVKRTTPNEPQISKLAADGSAKRYF